MKHIKTILLLIFPLLSWGQESKVPLVINGDTIATREWVRQQQGTATPDTRPVCERGPDLLKVYAVTGTGLTFQFDGKGVTEIQWNASGQAGSISPKSNSPSISFGTTLQPGNYTLTIDGKNCRGKNGPSSLPFIVPGSTGVVPPVVEPGNVVPAYISKGLDDHMNLEFAGSSANWLITDKARPVLEDGYEFRYIINGQIILQKTPLQNYKYQSNQPIRVLKFKTKVGLTTLNKWEDKPGQGYYDKDAGAVFSYNVSAAFYTGVFKNAAGTVIPLAYDPAVQTAQWADIISFKLPKGHFFVAPKGEWNNEQQLAAGVTHVSHFSLPWDNPNKLEEMRAAGITYSDVQRPENFIPLYPSGPDKWVNGYNLRYWPNGPLTEQESIVAADRQMIHNLNINETEEGNSFMPKDQPMWGNMYKRWRFRQVKEFDEKGIPSYLSHNYYTLGLPELNADSQRGKSFEYSKNPNTEGSYELWKAGSLKDNNLICIGIYLNAPDIQLGIPYNTIYQSINNKSAGQYSAVFLAGVHEWRPNNLHQVKYSNGNYYQYEKMPLEPNLIINSGFLSQVYGAGSIEWGGAGKQTVRDVNVIDRSGIWFPTGATSPQGGFPHGTTTNNYYLPYTGEVDLLAFGTKLYANTFGQVAGGETLYLRHRIDGGPWVTPFQSNADEVTEAFFEKRGLVYAQLKGGRIAWFYMNPFADNLAHKLEVILPDGRTITDTVSTTAVHAKLI